MLARVMRKWDEDGVPDPDATAFGEFVLKASLGCASNQGVSSGGVCWTVLGQPTRTVMCAD
jgi:hypothetical protein